MSDVPGVPPQGGNDVVHDRAGARRRVWIVSIVVIMIAAVAVVALRTTAKQDDTGEARGPGGGDRREATIVRAETSRAEDVTLTARYTGELDADVAEVASRSTGLLEDVRVRIGDRVARGDLLAVVDTAQLRQQIAEANALGAAATASERRAAAQLRSAQSELQRTEPLLSQQLVSPQEVDALRSRSDSLSAEAEAAQAQRDQARARVALLSQQIRDARVVAPFDGAVAERYLDPGAVVQPGTKVLRIVRSGPLRVQFRVPERDVGRLANGLAFEVTTQATGDRRFRGTIARASAEVSRSDRTVAVEGVLDEEAPELRPGMFAEAIVSLGTLEGAITVPGTALVERPTDDGATETGVWVTSGDRARFVRVSVRGRTGDRVAIDGLRAGETVITLGHDALRDGAPVQIVGREERRR